MSHGCHLVTTVYPSDLAWLTIAVCHAGSDADRDLPAVRAGRTVFDHGSRVAELGVRPAGPDLVGGVDEHAGDVVGEVVLVRRVRQPRLGAGHIGRVGGRVREDARVRRHPLGERGGGLDVRAVRGDHPDAAAHVARVGGGLPGPLQRRGRRHLPGRDLEGRVVQVLALPGRPDRHEHLAAVEALVEEPLGGDRLVGDQRVEQVRHPRAVRRGQVDLEGVLADELLRRALARPEVGLIRVGVADGADDVAGVLLRDLLAEGLVLLPCGRDLVAPLVHEGLVVPEHDLRDVVAQAVGVPADLAGAQRSLWRSCRGWTWAPADQRGLRKPARPGWWAPMPRSRRSERRRRHPASPCPCGRRAAPWSAGRWTRWRRRRT